MTGKKEKGELKTTSLTKDQIVSEEIHRNDSSQVSLSILKVIFLHEREYEVELLI